MLVDFFLHLKTSQLPVSTREFLTLLSALQAGIGDQSTEDFYFLSRACLVKDESHYDRFDRAFADYFNGVESIQGLDSTIPDEWLRTMANALFSPERKSQLEKLGWEKLMETLKARLAEQKEAHHGGSKWIGTGGSSPFGNSGHHPEGIRMGGESAGNGSAVKVWQLREFRNLDDTVELGSRNIKIALRRLRRFAREGAADQFDLDRTIDGTARNAGWLDLKFRPERHNKVKVLLFFDIGGSMDHHIRICEELFSATRSEFKHLESFYFHNCIYDFVWTDNGRRHSDKTSVRDIMHKYGHDYKLIIVGDATMSPYEILQPGGNLEAVNEEAGAAWLTRLFAAYSSTVWMNPEPERLWPYRQSIQIIEKLSGGRMFPLTLAGIDRAMQSLNRRR